MTELSMDEPLSPNAFLTSHQAALLLQVNPSSINNWVKAKRIAAFKTPGGHRRIRANSLAQFARLTGLPVPNALAGMSTPTVLWIEPDAKRAKLLEGLTLPTKTKLSTARNGLDGLICLGMTSPDVLVIDGLVDDLPRAKLVEAARRHFKAIKVVYVDASLTPEEIVEARELGVAFCATRKEDVASVLARAAALVTEL